MNVLIKTANPQRPVHLPPIVNQLQPSNRNRFTLSHCRHSAVYVPHNTIRSVLFSKTHILHVKQSNPSTSGLPKSYQTQPAMTNKLVVIVNSLKVPKITKILLCEMKFLVPNYSCLQDPWLGSYRPQIPVLCVLCPQLNLLKPHPKQNSWDATALNRLGQALRVPRD